MFFYEIGGKQCICHTGSRELLMLYTFMCLFCHEKVFPSRRPVDILLYSSTMDPRYKEVGYNKALLQQGTSAGPNSLYFFVFLP